MGPGDAMEDWHASCMPCCSRQSACGCEVSVFYLNTVFRYLLWSSNLVAYYSLVLPVMYHLSCGKITRAPPPPPPPFILGGLVM
jgi:hypothetical protein